MIARYQRKIFKELCSDEKKFESFLKVEISASYAWMKLGLFDESTFNLIKKASFLLDDIYKFDEEVKHDVIAFTKAVSKTLGKEKKWFHYGLTSTDIVDSAQSLILKEVNEILLIDINQFMNVLKDKAIYYKDQLIMGRTHGMHAEVTSFGLKYALWYEDFKRLRELFLKASKNVSVIKLSGAVGNFSASNPLLQSIAANYLNLDESNISTQTLQRDRHANYLSVVALIGAELDKIATEIRHLSRTEVKEVSEYFDINQKGSSAMPHKKNPISSENISGLSRVLKGYMLTSFENISLWHERDISHSSAERIILSDATTLLDYMLNRYKDTINQLIVYPKNMLKNIEKSNGLVFTQSILNHLIHKEMDRYQAYDIIQKLAIDSINNDLSFYELVKNEKEITKYIDLTDLDQIFSLEKHLKYVDYIYSKVFS
jgi:adenylosuccinate lyase